MRSDGASGAQILRLVAIAWLCAPLPATADFESKRIDEGVYYVSFQRSEKLSRGMFDTDKQVRKKLESKTAKLCRGEGFKFVRYPTSSEIRRDNELRRAWAGGHRRGARSEYVDALGHPSERADALASRLPVSGALLEGEATGVREVPLVEAAPGPEL